MRAVQVYATWKNPYAPGDSGARKNPQGPNPIKKVTQRKPEADFWKYGASNKRYDMEAKSPSQSFSYGLPKYSAETDNGGSNNGGGNKGGNGGRKGGRGGGGGGEGFMKGPTNVLGLLLVAAGLFAYFSAGSKQSLLFGMGSGIMLLFAGTLMADAAVWVGPATAFLVVVGLAYKMGQRYQQTKKVFPSGALAGVCGLYAVGYLAAMLV